MSSGSASRNPATSIAAIVLGIVAVALVVWQFFLRPSPNAVGVSDMPPEVRATGAEQRDPNAGPVPVDLSRRRGPASPTGGP
jgi:hypothetical protein